MSNVPSSTGIGAPGNAPAPANLARSPMASSPNAAPTAIPFSRASTLASMKDYGSNTIAFGSSSQVDLQTNAFLENLILDINVQTSGNSATVAFAADSPWQIISQITLDDPAGQQIIAPISGYNLYLLNKYLPDTDCAYDPKLDPQYLAKTGTAATGGSFSFRLVVPIEHRRRDALGALNNSAANQAYRLTINWIAAASSLYSTAPTTEATTIALQIYQQYWTSPPGQIATSQGSSQTQQTPSGLGTVGFVRYERHNEVSGGGTAPIQLTNVGDYISSLIFVLRDTAGARDLYPLAQSSTNANWQTETQFLVNDFKVASLFAYGPNTLQGGWWPRQMARFYGLDLTATYEGAGGLDNGVYVLPNLFGLFDRVANFGPANQYLPTDATTKLQIEGSGWGSGASYLEVIVRLIRPVSGAALFA